MGWAFQQRTGEGNGWIELALGVKAQVSTMEERLVVKIVGTLTASDRQNLDEQLRNWLQL